MLGWEFARASWLGTERGGGGAVSRNVEFTTANALWPRGNAVKHRVLLGLLGFSLRVKGKEGTVGGESDGKEGFVISLVCAHENTNA